MESSKSNADRSDSSSRRSPSRVRSRERESADLMTSVSNNEGEIDESNAVYQAAMKKLVDASWKYSREKDGPSLRALENPQLEKEFFRTTLIKGLNCKVTRAEFDSLLPLFQNGEFVDGCEFVCLFYRLQYEFRSKLLSSRIALEQRKKRAAEDEAKQKIAKIEEKMMIKLTRSYTEKDFQSAMDKLTEAAYKYDRLMPGSVQLDAFECEKMRPEIFREQVKRAFRIQLTIPELDALFDFLVKDEEGEAVLCANFLVQFFRLGFQERSRRLKEIFAEKKRIEKEREEKKLKELEELEKKNALKCTYEFTAEEKERALMKLREAAKLYDKRTPGAVSMKAFEVASMPPHIFKEQLKRVFNLRLSPAEMGALMTIFDVDGDGDVTCEEFSKTFLAMGFAERERELKEQQARQKAADEARIAAQKRKEEELAAKNAKKYTFEYGEKDFESAIAKMTEAAWKFDKNMPGAPSLVAFDRLVMEPHDFKEQLHRAFNIQITPPELGALLTYFNADESGNVTCAQFLIKFFKLGFQERQRRRQQWLEYEKSVEEERKKIRLEKQIEAERKIMLKVDTFTEEEFQSAFSKLTNAAVKYENNSYGAKLLAAFEAESMPPHVFREQLKIALKIRLTIGELGALMSYFDRENKGEICCKDFLVEFYRTGVEERDRIRASWRQEQQEYEQRLKETREEREKQQMMKAMTEVNYEFTELDFDDALKKLVNMSRLFDTRQLGAGGFNAFTVDSLTPSEFKEMLRRTFNVKLTPPQLGAMTTYFDPSVKGVVSCNTFINTFLKIRVRCETFKGQPDEKKLVAEYVQQLKEGYKNKVQQLLERTQDMELRPWRMYRHKKRGMHREHHPFPETAFAKLRLRIQVAKKSGRLDLSTKKCWPEEEEGEVGDVNAEAKETAHSDSELEIRKRAEAEDVAAVADPTAAAGVIVPVAGSDQPNQPKVIDATDEDRKTNAAIAVETAAAVGRLTLASAFVQGEAVVRKVTATGLPRLDIISSIGGKQNPFIRMSLKSTGERAFSPVLVDPGADCMWDLLDLYLGGAFIAAKRMQRFGARKGAKKKEASSGSVVTVGSTATAESLLSAPLLDDNIEHVLEVEVLNESIVIPDALIGIASAPLPNVPIGSIGLSEENNKSLPATHSREEAIGMAQWRLELSLDLMSSTAEDAKPAGNLALEVEVPAASDNIPDSVVTIKSGTIAIKKVNVYDLEFLSCTDGSVSKDSPPSYVVFSIGDDWKVATEVKKGKLLVFDIPSTAQEFVSPLLTNKAFLHRRLNVALMHKYEQPTADSNGDAAGTANADGDVSKDILVAQGSMSLRGAAYQEGHTASLSLLLKDTNGNPVSRVSINAQVDRAPLPGDDGPSAHLDAILAAKNSDLKRTLSKQGSRRRARLAKANSEVRRRRHSIDAKQALKQALQMRQAEGHHVEYHLRSIPEEVFSMTNLKELWLSDNLLSTIPSEIGDLKQLQVLSLARNDIERLPPEISMLDKLQRLHLGGNCLNSLPDLFFKLRQLQELDLSGNEFVEVPVGILGLSQLMHLNLSENMLTDLPEGIRKLRSLVTLDIRFNNFGDKKLAVLADMAWVHVMGAGSVLPEPRIVDVPVLSPNQLPKRLEIFFETSGRSIKGNAANYHLPALNVSSPVSPKRGPEVPEQDEKVTATAPSSSTSSTTISKAAELFQISREDEWELEGFLRRRAKLRSSAGKLAKKLRRRIATRSPTKAEGAKNVYNPLMERAASRSRSRPTSPMLPGTQT